MEFEPTPRKQMEKNGCWLYKLVEDEYSSMEVLHCGWNTLRCNDRKLSEFGDISSWTFKVFPRQSSTGQSRSTAWIHNFLDFQSKMCDCPIAI